MWWSQHILVCKAQGRLQKTSVLRAMAQSPAIPAIAPHFPAFPRISPQTPPQVPAVPTAHFAPPSLSARGRLSRPPDEFLIDENVRTVRGECPHFSRECPHRPERVRTRAANVRTTPRKSPHLGRECPHPAPRMSAQRNVKFATFSCGLQHWWNQEKGVRGTPF